MTNEIPNFFEQILSGKNGYPFSESDIISSYIDGTISKEEYIRRMNNARGKSTSEGN